jgi:putative transposase
VVRLAEVKVASIISKFRRTVRDYERLPEHHEAMIQWAMIAVMARRLARHHSAQPRAA